MYISHFLLLSQKVENCCFFCNPHVIYDYCKILNFKFKQLNFQLNHNEVDNIIFNLECSQCFLWFVCVSAIFHFCFIFIRQDRHIWTCTRKRTSTSAILTTHRALRGTLVLQTLNDCAVN